MKKFVLSFTLALSLVKVATATETIAAGISLYDQPKYPDGFAHFDYVNPDAPKGGTIRSGALGAFDSFNQFIAKGDSASTNSIETLTVPSEDEPFTQYCLICETMRWPEDRSWIEYTLRDEAKWHDGQTIGAEDVKWTFETLVKDGAPQFRFYYADVTSVEVIDDKTVRFNLGNTDNRELLLIIGQLPVLPKHYWADKDFTAVTLDPPLGSGPYVIDKFDAGRFIEYKRVTDYWGAELAVNKGINNFDTIRVDYFNDRTPWRLAIKAGDIDFYAENTAKSWATEFETPSIDKGFLKKESIPFDRNQGLVGFIMNIRKPLLQDVNVRKAIALAFDFEWTNTNIFYGQYQRSRSYYSNSEMEAKGLPSPAELAILEPYRDQLAPEVFGEAYQPPVTDGSGRPRENLREAKKLLNEAGWSVKDGVLVNSDGKALELEFLSYTSSNDRFLLPYAKNLERLGIKLNLRTVDTSQYIERINQYDFDMTNNGWGQSESPGNEQREYWSCSAKDQEGGRNYAGICDPVIDALIEELIRSNTREELVNHTKALDRVLMAGYYVVPGWYLAADRIVYWNKFDRPKIPLKDGVNTSRWWYDEAKANALEQVQQ